MKVETLTPILVLTLFASILSETQAFTRSGSIFYTDGSQADVSAAISAASAGDTVRIPEGNFTWGSSGSFITVHKAITLEGAGSSYTTITLANSGPTYTSAVIRVTAQAVVANMTIIGSDTNPVTAFSCTQSHNWRLTEIKYVGGTAGAYFAYCNTYGLIDNCDITGNAGTAELIFTRGPGNAWQSPRTMGTAEAVYIEDCVFNGRGYVCDFNSNAKGVVRFNRITGQLKVDAHGKASNSPPRSARHTEVYKNDWTNSGNFWTAVEIRGGGGRFFGNTSNVSGAGAGFHLTEYGSLNDWANFDKKYQTPNDYPIDDQIGVGMDPKQAASEPAYVWSNRKLGAPWTISAKAIPQGAITTFGASFTIHDIVKADRDYYIEANSFNGTSGVGVGTAVQMHAIVPTKENVGFWVTDEGDWNSKTSGTDGRLYVWKNGTWVFDYEPYAYPHPLRAMTGGSPTTPAAPSDISVKTPSP